MLSRTCVSVSVSLARALALVKWRRNLLCCGYCELQFHNWVASDLGLLGDCCLITGTFPGALYPSFGCAVPWVHSFRWYSSVNSTSWAAQMSSHIFFPKKFLVHDDLMPFLSVLSDSWWQLDDGVAVIADHTFLDSWGISWQICSQFSFWDLLSMFCC